MLPVVLAVDLAHQGVDAVRPPEKAADVPTGLAACGASDAACTQALAARLGVSSFVVGRLTRGENGQFVLRLRLLAPGGTPLESRTLEAPNEWKLIDALHALAPDLAARLSSHLAIPLETHPRQKAWAPWLMGGGAAVLLGGMALSWMAISDANSVNANPTELTAPQAFELATHGAHKQEWGVGLLAVGAAALGAGTYLYFSSRTNEPRWAPTLSAGPNGAALSVVGRLP